MAQFAFSSPQTAAISNNLASIIGTPGQRQRARIMGSQSDLIQAQMDMERARIATEAAKQEELAAQTAGVLLSNGFTEQAVQGFGEQNPNLPKWFGPAMGTTLPNTNAAQLGDYFRKITGLNAASDGSDAGVFNGVTLMDGLPSANGVPVSSYNDRERMVEGQNTHALNEIAARGVADTGVALATAKAKGNQDRLTKREFPEVPTLTQRQGEAFAALSPEQQALAIGPKDTQVSGGSVLLNPDGGIKFDNRNPDTEEKMSFNEMAKLDELVVTGLAEVESRLGIERGEDGEIEGDLELSPEVADHVLSEFNRLFKEGKTVDEASVEIVKQLSTNTEVDDPWFSTGQVKLKQAPTSNKNLPVDLNTLEHGKAYTFGNKTGIWDAEKKVFRPAH